MNINFEDLFEEKILLMDYILTQKVTEKYLKKL